MNLRVCPMKNSSITILSICLCLLPLTLVAQTNRSVTIRGSVKNFSSQVMVEDLSDMQYLAAPEPERIFVPSADGKFEITFHIASPNYFRIGRNILYLSPGDDLTVTIDDKAPAKGEFIGRGS